MKKKRITSILYTRGKYGKGFRETQDQSNPFLYSKGIYPTKITAADLPSDYIQIFSRSLWYLTGYLKTSGIVDIAYTYCKENHLFKDDYIYISYKEKLKTAKSEFGFEHYVNDDICISGNSIIDIVLAAEKYSGIDTTAVRNKIEEKRIWLRDFEPDEYKHAVGEDKNIFDLWMEKGYIDPKLCTKE